jgi:hypothetical protein
VSGHVSILLLAIAFSLFGLFLAKRLEGSYAGALESSLRKQALKLTPDPALDDYHASVLQDLQERQAQLPEVEADAPHTGTAPRDPVVRQLAELRSEDESRVIRALSRIEEPHPLILHQLIQFLGDDRYAFFVMDHLRRAAAARVGQFVDALLDREESFGTRKRIPIILAGSDSQRGLDHLLMALSDPEFLIRFRCAHAMSQIRAKNPGLYLSEERIWQVLDSELQVGIDVWEQRRLVEQVPAQDPEELLEKPGDASLEYLFVLLGLVLPREPVSMAFRALQTDDKHMRGTALEYLQTVLPAHAWKSLEGLIGDRTIRARSGR